MKPKQHIRKQRLYFANKGPSSQIFGFSSGHVWMLELDYKESWMPKNWSFWTVVLEKIPESPLDCKEIKPVNPKGNQSWKLTPWKRPWCWERLKVGGERDDRGWDGWMVLPLQWIWVWVGSGSWWWTGKRGMLQSMGRKESDRTEQPNWNWMCANPCWLYCWHIRILKLT